MAGRPVPGHYTTRRLMRRLTVRDLTVRLVWELVPDRVACLAQLLVELEITGTVRR